jgi:hypothetical protein
LLDSTFQTEEMATAGIYTIEEMTSMPTKKGKSDFKRILD